MLPAFQGILVAGYDGSSAHQHRGVLHLCHHFILQPMSQPFHLRVAVRSRARCVETTHPASAPPPREKSHNSREHRTNSSIRVAAGHSYRTSERTPAESERGLVICVAIVIQFYDVYSSGVVLRITDEFRNISVKTFRLVSTVLHNC